MVFKILQFPLNFNRAYCKQTVGTLIRRCILLHLIWVCTVCLCPTKRMLGLYGLNAEFLKWNIPAPADYLDKSTLDLDKIFAKETQ